MQNNFPKSALGAFLVISAVFSIYNIYYSNKILPRVFISAVNVGSITQNEAANRITEVFEVLSERGIEVIVEENREVIDPKNIDLKLSTDVLAYNAWSFGREGRWYKQVWARIKAPFSMKVISGNIEFNEEKLKSEVDIIALLYDSPALDMRYSIEGKEINILYDTKPGKLLNRSKARNIILAHIKNLDSSPINLSLDVDMPRADPSFADAAKYDAGLIMANPIILTYRGEQFVIDRERIGEWIVSEYEGTRLTPGLDNKLLAEYVIALSELIDITSQSPKIIQEGGKVIDFTVPRQGRTLLQDDTLGLITETLLGRLSGDDITRKITLPVLVKKPKSEGTASELGITELIGVATTPFYGSPKNRVHNITNGVRFLTGTLVAPGEEFSTIETLGQIDNTTGYLPELVIKGNETIPEFGGGLCQVSTTLFRAVMDTGLPVTARRNHSYRVPYYERDGEGNFIGPGLDATIYSPNPDFRFRNDTESYILIQGYVEGDKVTFEFYGTSDGRKASVDGPHTLSEVPAGDPIYRETDTLPAGETKKIDTAHPGGVAVATYTIEYADGTVEEQEFKSYYRKWPAKYLVGTREVTAQ